MAYVYLNFRVFSRSDTDADDRQFYEAKGAWGCIVSRCRGVSCTLLADVCTRID